jgi:uncharacterized membrane protein YjfL (UPF0719 family)
MMQPWMIPLMSLTNAFTGLFAQDIPPETTSAREWGELVLVAVVFTLIGIVLFAVCLWLIVKLAPFSIRKEIEEDQNTALGIIIGSIILGVALILAAAIHG